jgi:SAM-dependent methyltransferase
MIGSSFVRKARRIASLIVKSRRCPMCGWTGFRFEPFGNAATHRQDAQCPICGSLERHRLAFLLLRDRITPGQRILHVAPERVIIPWLVSLSSEYLNIDLYNPAMQQMDLTYLELYDGSKTLVWCSHVLEHIPDDRKALSEIHRVLEPGGVLVLQVPISGELTHENPSVSSDHGRLVEFLQEDHVRLYGLDLKERIERAGFECELLTSAHLSAEERTRHAVDARFYREVFFCHRSRMQQQFSKENSAVMFSTQRS